MHTRLGKQVCRKATPSHELALSLAITCPVHRRVHSPCGMVGARHAPSPSTSSNFTRCTSSDSNSLCCHCVEALSVNDNARNSVAPWAFPPLGHRVGPASRDTSWATASMFGGCLLCRTLQRKIPFHRKHLHIRTRRDIQCINLT